jgi:hypothetical protein
VAPKHVATLNNFIHKILTNSLVTQFSVLLRVAQKILPKVIEQWGKLRCLKGGDIMHIYGIVSQCKDSQDVSFIHV